MRRAMKAPAKVGTTNAGSGTRKGLLILVNFNGKNEKMIHGDDSKRIFDQMLNGLNDTYGDNYGSVREYFRDQSYGQFDITFDVVGPVTVSHNMSYYGANNDNDEDQNPEEMIVEAIKLADPEVNFADYDWDGDGEVENIYVTYAGYGEAQGASENTIWPHAWALSESNFGAQEADGVKISTYACGSELNGTSGTKIDGIGTMCHEYSHCLGLPDFYDIDYSGGHGMFDWDLMDSGSYNGDGYCPAGYTAYEREFCGWLTYEELQPNTKISDMPCISDMGVAYVIYNDANHNEYFVLANHQKKGWNKKEAGHGLLILHVDYNQSVWAENGPNDNPSRQRMTIIPADNKFDYETTTSGSKYYYANAGDTYPGSTGNTELTDDSKPAAKLNNANTDGRKYMHKPITNISENNGLISFYFMKEPVVVEVPVIDDVETGAYGTTISLMWNAVGEAVSYDFRYSITPKPAEGEETEEQEGQVDEAVLKALTFRESFTAFQAESDGSAELSNSLNQYTEDAGWAGEKVFKGVYGAKLGSGSKAGYLTTPAYTCSSGAITLCLLSYKWVNSSGKADDSTLKVSVLDKSGNELTSQTITPVEVGGETYRFLNFTNVPSSYKIKMSTISGGKRVYLVDVLAFDGTFTEKQVDGLLGSSSSVDPVEEDPEAVLVEGIPTNRYTLSDLPANSLVSVAVRAVDAEGNFSQWSELRTYDTDEIVVLVSGLADTPQVSGEMHDLNGRRVSAFHLRRGIYLKGGRKVLVR